MHRPIKLSDRQLEVLTLLAAGCTTQETADRLDIAKGTVDHHLNVTFQVLEVHGRIQAINKARTLGLLPLVCVA